MLIGLFVLCLAFTEGTGNDWIGIAMIDGYHTSAATGTAALAVFLAAMTTGRWFGPALLDRRGRVPVLRVSAVVAVAGLVLVVFAHSIVAAFVGVAAWGVGTSLGFPTGMSAAADDPRRAAAAGERRRLDRLRRVPGRPAAGRVRRRPRRRAARADGDARPARRRGLPLPGLRADHAAARERTDGTIVGVIPIWFWAVLAGIARPCRRLVPERGDLPRARGGVDRVAAVEVSAVRQPDPRPAQRPGRRLARPARQVLRLRAADQSSLPGGRGDTGLAFAGVTVALLLAGLGPAVVPALALTAVLITAVMIVVDGHAVPRSIALTGVAAIVVTLVVTAVSALR